MPIITTSAIDFNLTFTFKDIFPTINDFLEWCNEENEVKDLDSLTLEYIFNILFREYRNTSVMYDTIEDFLDDFANYILDYAKVIKREKELIDTTYQLTNDEISYIASAITSTANNDNGYVDDVNKVLNYISLQQYSAQSQNKMEAYLNAINKLPTMQRGKIIDRFKQLFINIYNKEEPIYE